MRRLLASAVAGLIGAGVLAGGAAAAAPTPTADYRFLNTNTTSAGTAPKLANLIGCATLACPPPNPANKYATEAVDGLAHRVLTFSRDNGVSLRPTTGVMGNTTYTVVVLFRLHQMSKFNRILEFANGTDDHGLYISPTGNLDLYPYPTGVGTTVIGVDQWVQVTLTRDGATGTATGYVDGIQQFQVVDSTNLAVVDSKNTLRFFQDNTSGGSILEDSDGAVARVRIYNSVLDAGTVAALDRAAPAPQVVLGKTKGVAGSSVSVTGTNYGPLETVNLTFTDHLGVKTALGTATTDVSGAFSTTVTIPVAAAAGKGKLAVAGAKSKASASKAFTVS